MQRRLGAVDDSGAERSCVLRRAASDRWLLATTTPRLILSSRTRPSSSKRLVAFWGSSALRHHEVPKTWSGLVKSGRPRGDHPSSSPKWRPRLVGL